MIYILDRGEVPMYPNAVYSLVPGNRVNYNAQAFVPISAEPKREAVDRPGSWKARIGATM